MSDKHRIALITDTTCDIPQNLVDQYDIGLVPQILIWGTEEYKDRIEIDAATFYARLPNDPNHPSSSQPIPPDFVRQLEQDKARGAEEAVIITLSTQLSKTVASAQQAAEQVDMPVHVRDSRSVSMGLGFQVLAAARAREAGGDAQAMLAAADKVRETVAVNFTPETLEYLHRGGRIGGASKLLGTALQLKPQLYVDHKGTARVEAGERTRTRKKALSRLYELFFEQMDTTKPLHIAVVHINEEDIANQFVERIQAEHNPVELLVTSVGPVVGVHGGPGTVGIIGYYET